jgi:hypothetical protein
MVADDVALAPEPGFALAVDFQIISCSDLSAVSTVNKNRHNSARPSRVREKYYASVFPRSLCCAIGGSRRFEERSQQSRLALRPEAPLSRSGEAEELSMKRQLVTRIKALERAESDVQVPNIRITFVDRDGQSSPPY